VIVSAVADRYTRALQLLLAGDPEAAREELETAQNAAKHARSEGQAYWLAQVRALQELLDKDDDAFQSEMDKLAQALDDYYAKARDDFSSEAHLRLPMLGLTALEKRSR